MSLLRQECPSVSRRLESVGVWGFLAGSEHKQHKGAVRLRDCHDAVLTFCIANLGGVEQSSEASCPPAGGRLLAPWTFRSSTPHLRPLLRGSTQAKAPICVRAKKAGCQGFR